MEVLDPEKKKKRQANRDKETLARLRKEKAIRFEIARDGIIKKILQNSNNAFTEKKHEFGTFVNQLKKKMAISVGLRCADIVRLGRSGKIISVKDGEVVKNILHTLKRYIHAKSYKNRMRSNRK
jgi:hypothetical protein